MTPETKAKRKIYFALPETKKRIADYSQQPGVLNRRRARDRARTKTEAYKAWEESNHDQRPVKWLLKAARRRARASGILFDITEADVTYPIDGICPVFNVPMVRRTPYAPSLDRLDNSKGYIRGNVAIISWRANHLKSDGNLSEHRQLTEWMLGLEEDDDRCEASRLSVIPASRPCSNTAPDGFQVAGE